MEFLACLVCLTNPPQFTESFLCGPCFNSLRRDIATLVGAHTWLHLAMLNPAPSWKVGTIGRAPASTRPPFRLELFDARVDIEGKLTTWARAVAEDHVPALRGPADGQMATVGKWLIAQLSWISDQPFCDEMAREFRETASMAFGLVPWQRLRRDLPMPCPGCGYLTLSKYGGDDQVSCRNRACGKAMTWADYWGNVVQTSEKERLARDAQAQKQKPLHRQEEASAA